MTEETGPNRTTAIEEIRARANFYRNRSEDFRRSADRFESLARALEEINTYAIKQSSDGSESAAPGIGIGSDAEQALWQLAIENYGG